MEHKHGIEVVDRESPSGIERSDVLDVPGKGVESVETVEQISCVAVHVLVERCETERVEAMGGLHEVGEFCLG